MNNDRIRIKARAKTILRQADPKPWSVTLIHWFFSTDLCALIFLFFLAARAFSGRPYAPVIYLAAGIVSLVLALFLLVFHSGHTGYTLRLWRTGTGGPMDLVTPFFRGSEVLTLQILVPLIRLLWLAAGELTARGLLLLLHPEGAAAQVLGVLLRVLLGALVLNRQLGYSLALHILLAHPELSALDAIGKSRRMMDGRKLDYLILQLSFLGWLLLIFGIVLLALLPGILIQLFSEVVPLLAGVPSWVLIPFAVLGVCAAFPMLLWLAGYVGVSRAGFYEAASAPPFPGVSPAAPFGGRRLK